MKVVVYDHFFLRNLIPTLIEDKNEVVLWHPTTKPAFDLFYEARPNILFATSQDLDEATLKAVKKHRTPLRLLVWPNHKFSHPAIPRMKISERKLVTKARHLKDDEGIDVKFFSLYGEKIENLEVAPLTFGGVSTTLDLESIQPANEFRADYIVLEDYLPIYKRYVDTLKDFGKSVKIFANGWPHPECLGSLTEANLYSAIKTSVPIIFNEWHGLPQLVNSLGQAALTNVFSVHIAEFPFSLKQLTKCEPVETWASILKRLW